MKATLLGLCFVMSVWAAYAGETVKDGGNTPASEVESASDAPPPGEAIAPVEPEKVNTNWVAGLRPVKTTLDAAWSFLTTGLSYDRPGFFLRIGGLVHYDVGWMQEDSEVEDEFGDIDGIVDHTEFRRLRVFGEGLAWDLIGYKLGVEFSGDTLYIKDAFLHSADLLRVGDMKLGYFREPFSLEGMTSANNNVFMERSMAFQAFSPGRNVGIRFSDYERWRRGGWSMGFFREVEGGAFDDSTESGVSREGYGLTGRITGTPWEDSQSESLTHVGLSFSYRNSGSSKKEDRYSARPALRLAPVFVDTGNLTADDTILGCVEYGYVRGPFSVQSEYFVARVDRKDVSGSARLHGGYIQASYFLTGETRPYRKHTGSFGRVAPAKKFTVDAPGAWKVGGPGAWQVATRLEHVDLDDSGVKGGTADLLTLGLNWIPHPRARLMLNLTHANVKHVGDAQLLGLRFQVDF